MKISQLQRSHDPSEYPLVLFFRGEKHCHIPYQNNINLAKKSLLRAILCVSIYDRSKRSERISTLYNFIQPILLADHKAKMISERHAERKQCASKKYLLFVYIDPANIGSHVIFYVGQTKTFFKSV